jgi:hypothetical protein
MFVFTYTKLGLKITNKNELLEYDVWELYLDDGTPIAFSVFTTKSFGLKAGFSGSNGSSDGKRAIVTSMLRYFHLPGYYAEVSHKPEELARSYNAPVVCATFASKVLGKPVTIEEDGLHYTRMLGGVGRVTKVLVGMPKGVPTTAFKAPDCPMDQPRLGSYAPPSAKEERQALLSHFGSVLFDIEGG